MFRQRLSLPVFLFALCAVAPASALQAPAAPEGNTGRYELSTASAGNAMVVTAHPLASAAARDMLWAGGSAIDAAIAAQAVLGLVEPQSSGFGGGGFIVYHDGKKTLSFDGRETAPALAHANRFLDAQGRPLPFYTAVDSGLGVGVPGLVAALEENHQRHGRLPWKKLFEPAIRHAREGFAISPRLHALIARDRLLARKTHSRDYFFQPDGTPHPVGHVLQNPAYAAVLERIAEGGAKEFYRGKLMQEMVKSLAIEGADLTEDDWRNYRARISPALCHPYRQYSVCTAPPPAGGLAVLQTLAILDGFGRVNDGALTLHRLTEAERLSFADRQRYSADPLVVPVPVQGLLNPEYIHERRALIGDSSMGRAEAGIPPGLSPPWGQDGQLLENGTTHIVIADARDHWLSLTSSVEDAFGSRLLVNGMLFNNQLTDFSFVPSEGGRPLANRVQGSKRPRSAMSPVIVLDEKKRATLALGSPGGSRIIGYVLRALTASIDDGLSPPETVQLSHVLSRNGSTEIDSDLAPELRAGLQARGHVLEPADMNSGLGIIRRQRGQLHGAADPRREGRATGF